jgi:glycosyltransferase involved in cell wall biosynthesis
VAPLDGIICVSEYMQQHVESRLGNSKGGPPIEVVLNGVDLDTFTAAKITPEATEVLFVGQVGSHKGVDAAVKAAALTRQPIHLRIVGSSVHGRIEELTPYEKQLRTIAKVAERRGSKISFEAFKPHGELPEVYKSAGIMVVPSRFGEPFGLVCLEAMASGAAVIASNKGGLPSLCGAAALIIEPKPENIAHGLDQLIENRDAYLDLRHRARERAESLSWPNQYNRLMSIVTQAH